MSTSSSGGGELAREVREVGESIVASTKTRAVAVVTGLSSLVTTQCSASTTLSVSSSVSTKRTTLGKVAASSKVRTFVRRINIILLFCIVGGCLWLRRKMGPFSHKAIFARSVFYSDELPVRAGVRVEASTSSVTINRFPLM